MLTIRDIKRARLAAGLTQAKAAKLLNIARNSFSRWERGERRPSVRDEILVELLPSLATGNAPSPCAYRHLNTHVRRCSRCKAARVWLIWKAWKRRYQR